MLFHQHVVWCDEMCLMSQRASSLFWTILGCLCQTSQTASLSVLQFVVAVCCPIIYALYVRLIRVRGTPRFRTMWDCTCTDERELVGRLPFVFLYVRCSDNDPRDDKTRATPFGMALVLFAKEAPWGLGSRGCGPATATVSYDLRNV